MQRGEINPYRTASGNEGYVMVLTPDWACIVGETVTVAMVESNRELLLSRSEEVVQLDATDGLPRRLAVNLTVIQTVERDRITEPPIGRLSVRKMSRLDRAITTALGIALPTP
jgi:hypothetical protein